MKTKNTPRRDTGAADPAGTAPAPIYLNAEDLIMAELRHLPFAVHLDIKKAFEAGKRLGRANPRVLVTIEGGEEVRTTLAEFLADNADGLDEREIDRLRTAVLTGACYTGGGGAGGLFDIELEPVGVTT